MTRFSRVPLVVFPAKIDVKHVGCFCNSLKAYIRASLGLHPSTESDVVVCMCCVLVYKYTICNAPFSLSKKKKSYYPDVGTCICCPNDEKGMSSVVEITPTAFLFTFLVYFSFFTSNTSAHLLLIFLTSSRIFSHHHRLSPEGRLN